MHNIAHDIRYIPIFDISIQFKLCQYCITGLMYHDMVIYRYIIASLVPSLYNIPAGTCTIVCRLYKYIALSTYLWYIRMYVHSYIKVPCYKYVCAIAFQFLNPILVTVSPTKILHRL